ncbi:uncharacterized membrane protein YebE (DUF533 family) [Lewinella aquimaris]|uniref:Uncharacterized membrane protein YebE (DUF533 family) n=1 Tax=Neolewinella aquimaris TaxID=1835722 RepID=A0A840E9S2_9BACT|nr:hypothetical protein [Neolewinella aquimaris]MBB4078788.1 uncharacterized membrane protein YebE (DUF533 family) [Neolewinella aquimaris]
MDFIFTIALIYFAYRGYRWYTHVQQQVRQGPKRPPNIDITPEEEERDDYIDYEEVK